jgi:hypothetical protein
LNCFLCCSCLSRFVFACTISALFIDGGSFMIGG